MRNDLSKSSRTWHGRDARVTVTRDQIPHMTLARASRLLLAFAATLIVVWSFFDVGRRAVARWQLRHEKPVTLTVMHWGDQAEDQLVAKLLDRYARENP